MNLSPHPDLLNYYSTPGVMTDPGKYKECFTDLPKDIDKLCSVVQNNLIHVFWSERYGRNLTETEKSTLNIRSMAQKLALIQGHDPRFLTDHRPIGDRQVGNCRDFSLMLTAILRFQGIPARARCGFGAYFLPGHYEDHWVCEYWNASQNRWILVDAQLDEFQCKALKVPFSPVDVPRDQFVVAGQAWKMCRRGEMDVRQVGIFEMRGWWFIWGNVVRELLSFNKIELLPWDIIPGCMTHNLEDPLAEGSELSFYDGIAALTLAGDLAFDDLLAIYKKDARFHATSEILN
jgi:hypothetical protein